MFVAPRAAHTSVVKIPTRSVIATCGIDKILVPMIAYAAIQVRSICHIERNRDSNSSNGGISEYIWSTYIWVDHNIHRKIFYNQDGHCLTPTSNTSSVKL